MSASGSYVRVDRTAEGVTTVLLDRAAKRNAVDLEMIHELAEAFGEKDARAIVLGSTDPSCFCAGADLTLGDEERAEVSDRLYELYESMVRTDAPIIVAVGGAAVGGGAQLALAGDIRVAGPEASFRFLGPGHGLAVGAWGLPSVVGRGRALDLTLTMREVRASEALAIGLVDRLEPNSRAALAIATQIAGLETAAARRVKRIAVDASGIMPALARERAENRAAWSGSIRGLKTARDPRQ